MPSLRLLAAPRRGLSTGLRWVGVGASGVSGMDSSADKVDDFQIGGMTGDATLVAGGMAWVRMTWIPTNPVVEL